MSTQGRNTRLSLALSHSRAANVSNTRSPRSNVFQLKGTPVSPHAPSRNLPTTFSCSNSNENKASTTQSGTTIIPPELANVFASSPVQSAFLISSNPALASEFVETFNSSFTQSERLSEKLAVLRKAGTALSPRKNGHMTQTMYSRGTFRHARGLVEDGGEGVDKCVRVFEEKYWANMKGMMRDIETFRKLRMQEFRRSRPLSRYEAAELDRIREGFGGERVHGWAFSALKEMAMEGYDDEEEGPGLGALYAMMEAEAFVQQVARDQAKVGADAALDADLVVGYAVESALSVCAEVEVQASRTRVRRGLAEMRRIAVDDLAEVDPGAGGELLHICADFEVRLAGFGEDSEQVAATRYYAGIMETMDNH